MALILKYSMLAVKGTGHEISGHCRWLVGTPDLSDWLHFWKLKHGSKGEGFDPAIHFKVRHKQHWTPDRGPGEPS